MEWPWFLVVAMGDGPSRVKGERPQRSEDERA
jgi:hypothetical protein